MAIKCLNSGPPKYKTIDTRFVIKLWKNVNYKIDSKSQSNNMEIDTFIFQTFTPHKNLIFVKSARSNIIAHWGLFEHFDAVIISNLICNLLNCQLQLFLSPNQLGVSWNLKKKLLSWLMKLYIRWKFRIDISLWCRLVNVLKIHRFCWCNFIWFDFPGHSLLHNSNCFQSSPIIKLIQSLFTCTWIEIIYEIEAGQYFTYSVAICAWK